MSKFKRLGGLLIVGLLSSSDVRSAAAQQVYWTESTLGDFMILRTDLDRRNAQLLATRWIGSSGVALDIPVVSWPADLNEDGAVNAADSALLLGDWGGLRGLPC